MAGKYELGYDSWNRVQADIAEDLTVGIKVLSETDQRRIEKGTHAYVVLDLRTSFGMIRIRDIRIQWSVPNQRHFIRWRQWFTGRIRDGRKEYLDVGGPLDPDTRNKFADSILDVFAQIKEEAASGTLGRQNPQLRELKDKLELEATQKATEAANAALEAIKPEETEETEEVEEVEAHEEAEEAAQPEA